MPDEIQLVDCEKAIQDLDNDIGLYKDLLECWFSEVQFNQKVLKQLIQDNNLSDAAAYVHRMKGGAGSLGAKKLFDTAQRTEDILRSKAQGDICKQISSLVSVYERTNEELKLIRTNL